MGSIVIANDNEPADLAVVADDPVLPPDVSRMLDECDRVGIGMDMLMTLCRARLRALGADTQGITEEVLTTFRHMVEQRR
jgi:hypothetical protein